MAWSSIWGLNSEAANTELDGARPRVVLTVGTPKKKSLAPDVASGLTLNFVTSADQQTWTIGELASAAGITVRTLHHYDHLGLLKASARTGASHRRYEPDDVARLYRILALRSLGLGLEELGPLLDTHNMEHLRATILLQQERVTQQLDQLGLLRSRLYGVLARLDGATEPPITDLLDTLEVMTVTVQLDRIYTRLGDDGFTELADRSRVAKTDSRVEAVGTVDELNTAIGQALALNDAMLGRIGPWLRRVQNDLFDLGATLSRVSEDCDPEGSSIAEEDVTWLEDVCDEADVGLPPLPSFVLPGGTPLAAQLHTCRAVCRRAERRALAVPSAPQWPIRYLNRLSDVLFVLSRLANKRRRGGPLATTDDAVILRR